MDVVDLWKTNRLPAGRLNIGQVNTAVKAVLKEKFGEGDFIRASENYQFYLNHDLLKQKNLSVDEIVEAIRPTMLDFNGIAEVLNTHDLSNANINDYLLTLYKNGTHAKRSGDIQIVTEPGWMSSTIAATHGAPYNYDTHIPLLFFGWGIKSGETFSRTAVADTAPTVAALLKLLEPSGNIGHIIEDVMKK
jgi:hypothetical protein